MEHRWGERIGLNLPVELIVAPDLHVQGRLRDASISGCRVETDASCVLRPGADVEVLVSPPCALHEDVRLYGSVIRRSAEGCGIEWCELSPPGLAAMLDRTGAPPAESCVALLLCG